MRVTTDPVTVVSVLILAVAPQNWQRSGMRSRKRFGTARAYCSERILVKGMIGSESNRPIRVMVKKVCSWCHTVQDVGAPDAQVTHTICPKCMVKVQQEMDEYERKKSRDTKLPK